MFLDILGFWLFFYFYFFFDHNTSLLLFTSFSSEIQRTPRRIIIPLLLLPDPLPTGRPFLLLAYLFFLLFSIRRASYLLSYCLFLKCLVPSLQGRNTLGISLLSFFLFPIIYDQPQVDGRGQGRLISHGISAKRKGFGFVLGHQLRVPSRTMQFGDRNLCY